MPLYKLLGGSNAPLPTYHSCGLGIAEPPGRRSRGPEMLVEHGGFTHEAAHGTRARRGEIAAYKAVRSAIGPDVVISCDFNQGLPSTTALETCRAIDDGWTSPGSRRPVAYDDYDTQARLATKLATPIQVGENWWSWRVGKAAIEMGACDYVMPDLLRIGGVTGWMRLARVAETRAVPFSSHLSPDYSAHVLAATPTRHWLEFMDWGQDLLVDPLVPVKGFTTPRAGHRTRVEREGDRALPGQLVLPVLDGSDAPALNVIPAPRTPAGRAETRPGPLTRLHAGDASAASRR